MTGVNKNWHKSFCRECTSLPVGRTDERHPVILMLKYVLSSTVYDVGILGISKGACSIVQGLVL
jgi:hypothetical protein